MRHGVKENEIQKDGSIQGTCLKRTDSQMVSVNSRLKATHILCQRKAFYRQRIPKSSY